MLKKLIITLTASFILCSSTSFSSFAEQNEDIYSLLVLGDSISTGYGLDGYPETKSTSMSYANQLAERFSLPERFVNMAIDGQTSAELLEKLKANEYDELIDASDVIVVTIGGNDILYLLIRTLMQSVGLDESANFSELAEIDFSDENVLKQIGFYLLSGSYKVVIDESITGFKENFIEISDYIYSANPKALVVYQTVYNPMSGVEELLAVDAMCEYAVSGINSAFEDNIWIDSDMEAQKYYIADVYSDFLQKGEELTRIRLFDIHPSSDGHNRIFEICESLICDVFASQQMAAPVQTFSEVTTSADSYSQKDDSVENPCFGEVCDIDEADADSAQSADNGAQEGFNIFSGKELFIIAACVAVIIILMMVVAGKRRKKK